MKVILRCSTMPLSVSVVASFTRLKNSRGVFRALHWGQVRRSRAALKHNDPLRLADLDRRFLEPLPTASSPSMCTELHHEISTLDPKSLKQADYIDVSNYDRISIHPSSAPYPALPPGTFRSMPSSCRIEYEPTVVATPTGIFFSSSTFPPGTSGFLYFYTPSNGVVIGSELRFRITSSDDPHAFKDGQDLIALDGTTWRIPLLTLCRRRLLYGLYQRAQLDGFIPKILVPRLRDLAERCPVNRRSIVLHSLRQPFHLSFDTTVLRFWVATDNGCIKVSITNPFHIGAQLPRPPYTGSGIVQLEPSSLRRHQHFRKLVLRILKITKDETYKGFDKPKEGELMRRHHRLGQHKIWSFDVDSPPESVRHPEALKFLYQSS